MQKSDGLPVSVKGIVFDEGRVWLRKNPRGEWELPGGRLEPGEQPEQTVVRELQEELGFDTEVVNIIHSGVLTIPIGDSLKSVFIVSYLCNLKSKSGKFEVIGEDGQAEFRSFHPSDLTSLDMPSIYKGALEKALT